MFKNLFNILCPNKSGEILNLLLVIHTFSESVKGLLFNNSLKNFGFQLTYKITDIPLPPEYIFSKGLKKKNFFE